MTSLDGNKVMRFKQYLRVAVPSFLVGAFLMAMVLDARWMALSKAFMNPTVINGLTIQAEVIKK